ncbi:helix-turn-helix domain-containing protein [Streptomyces sp. NBC_00669]|uniref:helix-turn-helix domain-containing protein n=1 Tax=Streptomyces sp. NBC_00669 TaxID=2976011 RepID=UPI002E377756|nr:helix-turn-helix transcriptional regulator [Streptomyces sp. NBC_00669]
MTADLGDNVRRYRRMAGLSQEQLADEAELSTGTIQKVEQGGSVRIETLHIIARALGIRTSQLLAEDPPNPQRHVPGERLSLQALRIALTPPLALTLTADSPAPSADEEPSLNRLRRRTQDAALLYPAGRYESLAAVLPGLVRDADAAVTYYSDGEERQHALLARVDVLGLTGRYLTQVRQFDIAHAAIRAAITDARSAQDPQVTAAQVRGLCFVLLRTGRFDEAEDAAVRAMDLVEPKLMDSEPGQYAVWGAVAMEAAAAAVRNNRPKEAKEYRRAASVAAAAIGRQHEYDLHGIEGPFGPVTAAMKSVEDVMVIGDVRTVVRRAENEEALSPKTWKRTGGPSRGDRNRFALDVTRAYARTGDTTRAGEDLHRLYRTAPEWLLHQKAAVDAWQEIAAKRKRSLPAEMREVGRHLGIIG